MGHTRFGIQKLFHYICVYVSSLKEAYFDCPGTVTRLQQLHQLEGEQDTWLQRFSNTDEWINRYYRASWRSSSSYGSNCGFHIAVRFSVNITTVNKLMAGKASLVFLNPCLAHFQTEQEIEFIHLSDSWKHS